MSENSENRPRGSGVLRALLIILCVLVIVPLVLSMTAWLAYQGTAQEIPERARQPEPERLVENPGINDLAYDPAYEMAPTTEFRRQEVTVQRIVTDPQTGENRVIHERVSQMVPYRVGQPVPMQDQKSRALAQQILRLPAGDGQREQLIQELKTVLADEFKQRHTQQTRELESAQQRLDAVKERLAKREQLKEEIIQRRANELMGRPDVLQWEAGTGNALAPTRAGLTDTPQPAYRQNKGQDMGQPVDGPGPGALAPNITWVPSVKAPSAFQPSPVQTDTPANPTLFPKGPEFKQHDDIQVSPNQKQPRNIQTNIETYTDNRIETRPNVFAIARRLMTARMTQESAQSRFVQLSRLHRQNAVADSEVRTSQVDVEKARTEAEFAQAELDALGQRLKRDLEYAKSQLDRAVEILEGETVRTRIGTGTRTQLLKADGAVDAARKSVTDLNESLEQLQRAKDMIEKSAGDLEQEAASEFGGDDAEDPVDEGSKEAEFGTDESDSGDDDTKDQDLSKTDDDGNDEEFGSDN